MWSFQEWVEQERARENRRAEPAPVDPGPRPDGGGTSRYGRSALDAEVVAVALAPEGTRNPTLNTAAFKIAQLVAAGEIDQWEATDKLSRAAQRAGLEPDEIMKTLGSANRAGMALPRVVPDPPEPVSSGPLFTVTEVAGQVAAVDLAQPTGTAETAPDGPAEPTSWQPHPLTQRAANDAATAAPGYLWREDGRALTYPGKVNGLIGESESGKTWVALLAVAQAIAGGDPVLFLDFEDSAAATIGRLRNMGCTEDQLAFLDYANPDERLGPTQWADLNAAVEARHYRLIIVDGVNAAMTLLGLDLNSNTDATLFTVRILRPLAGSGAAVITVDHVPKNPDQRAKGGIGAQAKRAMMDGAAITVEVTEPFGVGQSGVLKLTVDKDRPGHVRGVSTGGRNAGRCKIESVSPDTEAVRIRIDPPDLARMAETDWQPSTVMAQISDTLAGVGQSLSFRQLKDVITAKDDTLRAALRALIKADNVRIETGPRRAVLHRLVTPYSPPGHPTDDDQED